jgi:protease I
MFGGTLSGKKIAMLVADGFEQVELTVPCEAIKKAGGKPVLVSLKSGQIQGMHHFDKGDKFDVNQTVEDSSAEDFDGLLLPGGIANPDTLRMDKHAVEFVRDFVEAKKPIAAICHGPWTLVEADAVRGRTLTSWPSLKTDIENAGGTWVDEECHVDNGLVTSRKPADLAAFCAKAIEEFAEGVHAGAKS